MLIYNLIMEEKYYSKSIDISEKINTYNESKYIIKNPFITKKGFAKKLNTKDEIHISLPPPKKSKND